MVAHIAAAPYINPTTNVNHEVVLRTSPMSTWYGKVLELIEIRRGLRPCSPDDLPYLGRSRRYDNVIIAAGHGMLGISLAPIMGKFVCRLSANQTPAIDLTVLRIERFN
jgi:glycine/D-amino acid oxidase-like deaminating enzyme